MSSPPGPNGSKSVAAQTTRSWGAAVTPDGNGRRPRLDPAQRGLKGRADGPMACGPAGPADWIGGGIPGQPLPGLPAGTPHLCPLAGYKMGAKAWILQFAAL